MIGLTEKEKNTIYLFQDRIMKAFGEKIISLYLFGSNARGDAGPESDIDLLVITAEDEWRLADKIRVIGYEIDDTIDYKLSIIVIPKKRIDYMQEYGFSFAKNVFTEGVALSRCYYAVLHAGKAVLFGKELIESNNIEKSYAIIFREEQDERLLADYDITFVPEPERVQERIEDAQKFIDRMKKYLGI